MPNGSSSMAIPVYRSTSSAAAVNNMNNKKTLLYIYYVRHWLFSNTSSVSKYLILTPIQCTSVILQFLVGEIEAYMQAKLLTQGLLLVNERVKSWTQESVPLRVLLHILGNPCYQTN